MDEGGNQQLSFVGRLSYNKIGNKIKGEMVLWKDKIKNKNLGSFWLFKRLEIEGYKHNMPIE